jgi:hypothetical protein
VRLLRLGSLLCIVHFLNIVIYTYNFNYSTVIYCVSYCGITQQGTRSVVFALVAQELLRQGVVRWAREFHGAVGRGIESVSRRIKYLQARKTERLFCVVHALRFSKPVKATQSELNKNSQKDESNKA